jgi:hypothetical protein
MPAHEKSQTYHNTVLGLALVGFEIELELLRLGAWG